MGSPIHLNLVFQFRGDAQEIDPVFMDREIQRGHKMMQHRFATFQEFKIKDRSASPQGVDRPGEDAHFHALRVDLHKMDMIKLKSIERGEGYVFLKRAFV